MNVVARRLIVIGIIAASGTAAGLALGNFVAGPETFGRRGMNESDLMDINASMVPDEEAVTGSAGFADRPGPSSYNCVGCDAHPYNEATPDSGAIDTAPMPPYQSEDAPLPTGTGQVTGTTSRVPPRQGASPSPQSDQPQD